MGVYNGFIGVNVNCEMWYVWIIFLNIHSFDFIIYYLFIEGERETGKKIYEILDRTGFHLKRGDLLEATIALNGLTGIK